MQDTLVYFDKCTQCRKLVTTACKHCNTDSKPLMPRAKKNMVHIHVQVLLMPGKKSRGKSYLENSEAFVYSGKFRKPRHMSKVRCVIRNTREGFKCLSWSLVSMQIWLIVELFSAKANLQSMGEGSLICFMIFSFCCSRICLPKHCLNTCSWTKASVTTLNNKYRLWKNLEKRH